jgi:hypothetical protein
VGQTDERAGCWPWRGNLNSNGYGRLYVGIHRRAAHRIAYELLVGPIPEGLTLDHLCRNHACCNPAHLEPVTNRENIMRGDTIPAANARKTHCLHGHEFTPENVGFCSDGSRRCRTCQHTLKRGWKISHAARQAALSSTPTCNHDYILGDTGGGQFEYWCCAKCGKPRSPTPKAGEPE